MFKSNQIKSIDNYYVQQYIKYAYPGLITYCLFIITTVITMVYNIIKYKSGTYKLLLIAVCCYFFNLWYLDALQTLKFVYVIIALFFACVLLRQDASKNTDEGG